MSRFNSGNRIPSTWSDSRELFSVEDVVELGLETIGSNPVARHK